MSRVEFALLDDMPPGLNFRSAGASGIFAWYELSVIFRSMGVACSALDWSAARSSVRHP